MDKSTRHVRNLVIFYLIWMWTMVGVSKEWVWLGPAVALCMITGHWLVMLKQKHSLQGFGLFAVLIVAAGISVDSLFICFGLFKFSANPFHDIVSPPWMMLLWLECALCLYISARDFFQYPGRIAICALIGASLFYAAMGEFGAIFLYDRLLDTVIVGLVWAVVMPVCLSVQRFVGPKS